MSTNAGQLFDRLVVETFRLNGRLVAAGDELVADLGLSSARWQVLGALELSPVALPVAHIARNMGLSRQAVQRLVNEMQSDGLVRLAQNPHHRRARLVMLTPAGKAAFGQAMLRQGPWAKALVKGISAAGLGAALEVLTELRKRLETEIDREGET
ncbi:DNA-binding transcriptional regulator, MarR family [Rhizobiales bacterium GAS191]|jgi:DNA-binding MarR family transcriptional regulator|nr:DNA-binding transcriptional regulator, MarR family [Rhizobiales bacterium GAS113]SEE10471.1 DNA-binding transcriptional regulator, MarR family [Rhizobiales bacterium GAS188]SEE46041.1 DNA-binding transcriptional regulator, MarR family [Rhizobiales bacterium GAS191]